MLISIIVPVYNAEKYLVRCLESLKNQTYYNIEVILINDGSTDNSKFICEEYSNIDSRFIVVNKVNGGVSSARNIGLDIAKGEYIGFVDPDDWVEINMLEKLSNHIKNNDNIDLVVFGYKKEHLNEKEIKSTCVEMSEVKSFFANEMIDKMIVGDKFKGYLWNKLFRADIFKCNPKIYMDENVHFCEDLLWCVQFVLRCEKVVYDSLQYYHYFIHDKGICQMHFSEKKISGLKGIEKCIEVLDLQNVDSSLYKNLYMHMNISLLMNGINEKKISEKKYLELIEDLKKYKVNELSRTSVKLASAICKINPKIFYCLWKLTYKKKRK